MLLDAVREVCGRLGPDWVELLRRHGLDLGAAVLADRERLRAELGRELVVDREVPGFEDFALERAPAAFPGRPAFSVLYHALASPNVHPEGGRLESGGDYPTLADLDAVESYVYGLAAERVDLAGACVAVFAYQYRPGPRAPHRRHADLAFARAGVARVGTAPPSYEGFRRSFWVEPSDARGIAVMPARYGAFLARPARAGVEGCVALGPEDGPDTEYLFPFHKLFDGAECIAGRELQLEFREYHVNDKVRRGADLDVPSDAFPLVRSSAHCARLVRLRRTGASVLVAPVPGDTLVRSLGAHVVDDTADGAVAARVRGLPSSLRSLPALSLVAGPGFFPLVEPEALFERGLRDIHPLSHARVPPRALPLPGRRRAPAFDRRDATLTAVVGAQPGPEARPAPDGRDVLTSFLPDAACQSRGPGADAARMRDARGTFLTATPGAAPFAVDLKRAAAGLIEGALAPDTARAFGARTRVPLLDTELGIHPRHPRRASRDSAPPPELGWDGGFGPFFETVGGVDYVNCARLARTDYVARARTSRLRVSLTARLRTRDLLTRWTAVQVGESVLEREGVRPDCLVVAESVEEWEKHPERADPLLGGSGFRFAFAELGAELDADEPDRVRRRADAVCELQLGRVAVAARRRGGSFRIYRIA